MKISVIAWAGSRLRGVSHMRGSTHRAHRSHGVPARLQVAVVSGPRVHDHAAAAPEAAQRIQIVAAERGCGLPAAPVRHTRVHTRPARSAVASQVLVIWIDKRHVHGTYRNPHL
jgi:hypothetical protein